MTKRNSSAAAGQPSLLKLVKSIDWGLVGFVAGACFLAMGYGMAAMKYGLPPSSLISQAKAAFDALSVMEDETLASSVERIDDKAPLTPQFKTLDPAAGRELLLVTGGPNQDATHCPKFGCIAWVIDRTGKVLHSWPLPTDGVFSGTKLFEGNADQPGNFYPVGIQLMDDGSLIAVFHARNTFPYAAGIARFARDGRLLWKHVGDAHHWPHLLPGNRIAAPVQVRREMKGFRGSKVPLRCKSVVYDEGMRIYSADGKIEKTVLMIDVLRDSDYPGLFYSLRDDCDPIHINSVDVVTEAIAPQIPGSAPGDLLVSLREPSAIALVDVNSGLIRRMVVGRTAAQHSAHFLPDGSVVAFDNLGGKPATGGSRIAHINLVDGSVRTIFPTAASKSVLPFFSSDGSAVSVSPDGTRLMIDVKDQSRQIEIDVASGRPLWLGRRSYDIGPFSRDDGKPVPAWLKAYGTYYVSDAAARALKLQ